MSLVHLWQLLLKIHSSEGQFRFYRGYTVTELPLQQENGVVSNCSSPTAEAAFR